uniref:Heat shock protein 70 n=1 Tax=Panagrolaimus davidi TaxID=227884 RepID=A0A914QWS9_9BILA
MDVVAIDLGMSKCCLAVGRTDGIKMVALGNTGSYLLPSYVSFRQNEPICGEIAVKDLQIYTNFTVFDVKRIIGKEYSDVNVNGIWPFEVVDAGDEPVIRIERNSAPILFSPSQVSAVLLKYIKKTAEDYQGRSLKHAVITVPAAFTFSQKRDTLEAAKIAGWEKVDLLLEPIAAAFSLKNEFGIDVLGQKKYRLLLECQEVKHSLSNNKTDSLDIGIFDVTKDGFLNVIRSQFENMSKELLSRIKDLVANTLIKAKYAPNDIDMVILAGGGCRMPMIREMLKEMFPGSEIRSQNNVEEVVAFGAARFSFVE